jgi:hypothetical protein
MSNMEVKQKYIGPVHVKSGSEEEAGRRLPEPLNKTD